MRNENDNVTKSSPSSSSSSSNTISSSLGYGLLSAKLLQMSLGLSIMTASGIFYFWKQPTFIRRVVRTWRPSN